MSDHMKEAERLLAEHEQAAGLCRYADCQTTRAALLAHIQRGVVPEGYDIAPTFRGYAKLGSGHYVLHNCPRTDEDHPSLVIAIATEEEKAGRQVGELRQSQPGLMIQPERIAVRIDFKSVAALDALEQQLRFLREDSFPDSPTAAAPDECRTLSLALGTSCEAQTDAQRAMLAADDYMKEAERLLSEYGDAVSDAVVFAQDPAGYSMRMEEATRAALLAHIQRGAVPSADQLWNNDEVMALNAELGLTMDQLSRLASAITRIAHPADWRERFSQAVYDDLAAADNQDFPLEEYPARILKVLDAVIGREIKPAPAEVPMPDDDIRRDALNLPTPTHIAPDAEIELDASIDAALRGEVK